MDRSVLRDILEQHKLWITTRTRKGKKANLSGADLSGANLTRAYLLGANLTRANLTRANLLGANLSGATLCDCNLNGATITFKGECIKIRFEKM